MRVKYKKWVKKNWLLLTAAGAGALVLSSSQQASEKKLADLEKQMALAQDRKSANAILLAQIEEYRLDTWNIVTNLEAIRQGLKHPGFNWYHNYSSSVPSRYDDDLYLLDNQETKSPEQVKVYDLKNRIELSNYTVLFRAIKNNKHLEAANEMDEVQYNKLLLEVVAALKLIKRHKDYYDPRFDWRSNNWFRVLNSINYAMHQDNLHGAVREIFRDIESYNKDSFRDFSLMKFPEVLNWIGDQEAILKEGEMKNHGRMAWFDNPYFR